MNPANRLNLIGTQHPFKARSVKKTAVFRLTVLFVLVGMIAGFLYSGSLASSSNDRIARKSARSAPALPSTAQRIDFRQSPNGLMSGFRLSLLPLLVDGITVQNSGCSSAQSTFNLNDTVCLTVTGSAFVGQRLAVTDPQNYIRQIVDISTSPQSATFSIPSTTTSTIGGAITTNNLGSWGAFVLNGRGKPLAGAAFVVKDPAQATANVEIFTARTSGDITANSTIAYDITMANYGPDAAVNASFTNPTPAFTTFVAVDGPIDPPSITCTDPGFGNTGDVVCTVASLAANSRVTFTVQYQVGNIGPGSSIGISATLTTDTTNIAEKTTASSTGTVTSDTPPTGCVLTCPANIVVTADTTGPNPADPSQTVPGAIVSFSTDSAGNCGTVSSSPASGSFFPVGTTEVSSTSSSGGGNCSFTVTVTESGGAVSIACPANKVANADANCSAVVNLGTPTTTGDNVTVTVTRSDGKPMYDCDQNGQNCVRKNPDLPFPAGITTVTWTASNSSGTESCTQTVEVIDVTPPTITASNQQASADANCQAAVPDFSTLATVTDNCACASSDNSEICDTRQDILVTQDVTAGTLVGLGSHTIHLTANDGSDNNNGAGNSTTISVTFTVVDTTPPTITAPAAVVAYTGAGATTCDTFVSNATLGTPTTADNCGPITVTRSPSGNTFPVGSTTVVWTATDGAGNQATANQTVTVIDNTPPVISCPTSFTIEPTCPSGAIATYTTPVGTDNCPGATTSRTAGLASGSVFPIGTTLVTYTVNDAHGNSAACSFTVTVKTAQQTIQDMMAAVTALQPPLSGTQVQGLNAKLQAALDAINQGKTNVACNKLADFISQVSAYINNGTLTSAQGTPLITSANHVRNTIGCTNNPCS